MMCYLDTTFCISQHCKNNCTKQLTLEIQERAGQMGLHLSLSYFCDAEGEPFQAKNEGTLR